LIGAPYYDNGETDEGRAEVFYGAPSGPAVSPQWTGESNQTEAYFGHSVMAAGDVNGDGYSDVIVSAPYYDSGQINAGRAYVYYGSAAGLLVTPAWTAESDQAYAYFGWSVAPAGDVNGDGYSDVIVGARYYTNGQTNEGGVFVYHGSAAGLFLTPDWVAEGNQNSAQFGSSVAAAGDVNGDGYSDVIIGAYSYDNGQNEEGRAFVYQGSPVGLSSAPDWTAESDQNSAQFGWSVASAGDVNGDGYSDVIIGARYFDNGEANEGRAYVFHGSPSGLSAVPDWTAESDQASALFGAAVASAGDVNGDGYSDVIVGAYNCDSGQSDEGRAYVFHGSPSGLSAVPDWTAEGNQDSAQFGWSVASAGDVNGDGYGDVLIGAPYYDNGESNEGRAYLYLGSPAGLSLNPDWTAESNQVDALFGWSVATAGDVNGDSYSDIIIGANAYDYGQTDEGHAWLYHGNAEAGMGLALRPMLVRKDNSAPVVPGTAPLLGEDGVRLNVLGRAPFGRSRIKLEWEIKPLGTPLDGTGTLVSNSWSDTDTTGVAMDEVAAGLLPGVYRWRVRLLYDPARIPFAGHSRWFAIPRNGWQDGGFRIIPLTVPDVTNMSQAAAEALINAIPGLSVGSVTRVCSDLITAGQVISQDPAAGSVVPSDTSVDLVVSTGQPAVPNVTGQTQVEAEAAINGVLGLSVGTVTQACSDTVPAGEAISQNPSAGSTVPCGTAVDLVISAGQPTVPDVTNQSQTEAEAAINGVLGLSVGTVTQACS
ncbi:MAG: PASTA domain-containing protein, partial [Bryobacteraceae bacterium]